MSKDYARAAGQIGVATIVATAPAPRDERHRQSAARRMNAQVARALAHVGLAASRCRAIIETIQTLGPKKAELNSGFPSLPEEDDACARRLDARAVRIR